MPFIQTTTPGCRAERSLLFAAKFDAILLAGWYYRGRLFRLVTPSSKGSTVSSPALSPASAKAKLQVVAGLRKGKTYGVQEGVNYIGRL